jgi:hypothetical protein
MPKQETTTGLLQAGRLALAGLLPASWKVGLSIPPDAKRKGEQEPDGFMTIRSPDGAKATLAVEAKASVPSVSLLLAQAQALAERKRMPSLLLVSYAGPGLRNACETRSVNYLDLTGWSWLRLSSPAVVIRTTGALRDPRPPRRSAIMNLGGVGAGRIIRSLLEGQSPVGVRALAERAAVTPGTVSKVLRALEGEGALERSGRGAVKSVAKRALVERWVRDYSFLRANSVGWYLAPRGVAAVLERARDIRAVGTGSLALRRYLPESEVPITVLAQVALYVEEMQAAASALALKATDRATANVLLVAPYDPQLLQAEPKSASTLALVSAGQAVADLLTSPGRGREEAEQLMDSLSTLDPAWR